MRNFEYFAPETVEEARSLLSRYADEAKIIAGDRKGDINGRAINDRKKR